MKIYLAGPMRGIPEFNFPEFHRYAKKLREQGHTVFSPAEQDIETYGCDISKGIDSGSELELVEKFGFDLRKTLCTDLSWICLEADAVALMPEWKKSRGAQAERATAIALGLNIIELE